MSKAKNTAREILDLANQLGWNVNIRNSILTISKDGILTKEDFTKADGEYFSILEKLPMTSPGSVWGTDGGGMGALTAMKTGTFVMNKSGGSKSVIKALSKM